MVVKKNPSLRSSCGDTTFFHGQPGEKKKKKEENNSYCGLPAVNKWP